MNRRSFLKRSGALVAVGTLAPKAIEACNVEEVEPEINLASQACSSVAVEPGDVVMVGRSGVVVGVATGECTRDGWVTVQTGGLYNIKGDKR